jgi:hypothetical protein
MDATVRLAGGGALGRRAAARVFVAAELDGAPPANPYTRLPFTAADEAALFSARATRARPAPRAATYAAWRATPEGAAVAREMAAARAAGDAARAADADAEAWALADADSDADASAMDEARFAEALHALRAARAEFTRTWDAMEAHGVDALAGAPADVRADADFVLAAMDHFGAAALRHAADAVRADAAFVRRAVHELGEPVLPHAAAALRADPALAAAQRAALAHGPLVRWPPDG